MTDSLEKNNSSLLSQEVGLIKLEIITSPNILEDVNEYVLNKIAIITVLYNFILMKLDL